MSEIPMLTAPRASWPSVFPMMTRSISFENEPSEPTNSMRLALEAIRERLLSADASRSSSTAIDLFCFASIVTRV